MDKYLCAICGEPYDAAANYPHAVCRKCDERAINESSENAKHASQDTEFVAASQKLWQEKRAMLSSPDGGDNPVYIDGIKCWRRYRFGGWITMQDAYKSNSEGEHCRKMFEEQGQDKKEN